MDENRTLMREYPTVKACILVFVLVLALTTVIGSALQYYAFLPGLYVTEWLLILGPPLILLWRKKVNVKETLKLQHFTVEHVLLGVIGGLGMYFISIATVVLMEDLLGPYPAAEFIERAFPKTWVGFIPWILAVAFSAGICEEVLFRGFIQNGLHTHWGPGKALMVSTLFFTIAHLDPWRTPAVILLGSLAGYMLIRTGSLYSAIAVHMTANTASNVLAFTEKLPEHSSQWLPVLCVSVIVVVAVFVIIEMKRKQHLKPPKDL